MVKSILRSFILNAILLWLLNQYVSGFHLTEGLKSLLIIAAALTILHAIVKFLLDTVLGSLNFLTLGVLGLILDSLVLYGLTLRFPQLTITAWTFPGLVLNGVTIPPYSFNAYLTTIFCALVINVARLLVNTLV